MKEIKFLLLQFLGLLLAVMAQDEPPAEEVEEPFDWTSPLGIFCAASICLGFCVPCVGLLCYMCANRDMKPLNA